MSWPAKIMPSAISISSFSYPTYQLLLARVVHQAKLCRPLGEEVRRTLDKNRRPCRGVVVDDKAHSLPLDHLNDESQRLPNGYCEENRPQRASLGYSNERPEDHIAGCDSTSGL